MTTYKSRPSWTKTPKPDGLETLDSDSVVGLALHWPGTEGATIGSNYDAIVRRLESYRLTHVRDRGWTDIAYQAAVDQAGRVWDLRGIEHRSAANGNSLTNSRYGAVLVMVGAQEKLTVACEEALRDLYRDRWLKRYPRAKTIVGHRDIRPDPTDCPGNEVLRLIDSGFMTIESVEDEEDDNVMILYVTDTPGDESGETAYQIIGEKRRAVKYTEVEALRRHGVKVVFIIVSKSDPISKLPILS